MKYNMLVQITSLLPKINKRHIYHLSTVKASYSWLFNNKNKLPWKYNNRKISLKRNNMHGKG
jgi:hypothetical protein